MNQSKSKAPHQSKTAVHSKNSTRQDQETSFIESWQKVFRDGRICAIAANKDLANRERQLAADTNNFSLAQNVGKMRPDTTIVELSESAEPLSVIQRLKLDSRVKVGEVITRGWTFRMPAAANIRTQLRMVLTEDGTILKCEVDEDTMPDEEESNNDYRLRAPLKVAAFPSSTAEHEPLRQYIAGKREFAQNTYAESLITPLKISEAAAQGYLEGKPTADMVMAGLKYFMQEHGLTDEASEA